MIANDDAINYLPIDFLIFSHKSAQNNRTPKLMSKAAKAKTALRFGLIVYLLSVRKHKHIVVVVF